MLDKFILFFTSSKRLATISLQSFSWFFESCLWQISQQYLASLHNWHTFITIFSFLQLKHVEILSASFFFSPSLRTRFMYFVWISERIFSVDFLTFKATEALVDFSCGFGSSVFAFALMSVFFSFAEGLASFFDFVSFLAFDSVLNRQIWSPMKS